jgi:rhamnosyltransferase
MGNGDVKVSIIIPTRNGMPLVEHCLRHILAQKTPWPFEVIAVDSGSNDGTWELLCSLPIKAMRIQPQDFNHGATRNQAAQQARGELLVFFVQDAIPADSAWLANLVAPFDRAEVAGAYSRQVPRADSNILTKYMTIGTTPNEGERRCQVLPPRARSLADLDPGSQFELALFQNASSCIRRSVFLAHPFAPLRYGEDIDWGRRAIEAGYSIVYEPSSVVFHSHDRSALYALKRAYADHYQAAELFGLRMIPSVPRLVRSAAWSTIDAWRFVLSARASSQSKLRSGVLAPLFMLALAVGQYLGAQMYVWLPRHDWLRRLDRRLRVGV